MNDTELMELCKEVYEKTGWRYDAGTNGTWYTDGYITLATWVEGGTPLYTSDYLLEKIGNKINISVSRVQNKEDFWWSAYLMNPNTQRSSDTPLKALLKLTIALHKAGELHD